MISTIKAKKRSTPHGTTSYNFAKNASDTENPTSFTFNDDGFLNIAVTFDHDDWSQVFINLNGYRVGQFTANGVDRYGEKGFIGIPILNGDVVSVNFYNNYGVLRIDSLFIH